MNVTELHIRDYLETFLRTLEETAAKYLKSDSQRELLHLSLLPAQITAYVSTQFGLAIEYKPHPQTEIKTIRGSTRVEDLLLQPPRWLSRIKPTWTIAAEGIWIANLTFDHGFPFRIKTEKDSVNLVDVVTQTGEWRRTIQYAEVYGNQQLENWTKEKAVARAKDEVLTALVEENRAKKLEITIPEYIKNRKSNQVLVLGDYKNGRDRLENISNTLRSLNYEPILVEDVPDIGHYIIPQKVVALAAISRFIVIDDSSPAGQMVEVEICRQHHWVTVVLRNEGIAGSWMTVGDSLPSNVMLEEPYDSDSLAEKVVKATEWAENKIKELELSLNKTYPWRLKK